MSPKSPEQPKFLERHLTDRRWGDQSLSWSANSLYLAAAGSEDTVVRIWQRDSWEIVRSLTGHSDKVTSVAFSTDEKKLRLATASWDRTIRVWTLSNNEEPVILRTRTPVNCIVLTGADGNYLKAGGDDGSIDIWDVAKKEVLYHLEGHQGAVQAIDTGRRYNASASVKDGTVRIWDSHKELHCLQIPDCYDLVFAPDGRKLALAISSEDPTSFAHVLNPMSGLWDSVSGEGLAALIGDFGISWTIGTTSKSIDVAPDSLARHKEWYKYYRFDSYEASYEHVFPRPSKSPGLAESSSALSGLTIATASSLYGSGKVDIFEDIWGKKCHFSHSTTQRGSVYKVKFDPIGDRLAYSAHDGLWILKHRELVEIEYNRYIEEEQRREQEVQKRMQLEQRKIWQANGCCVVCGRKLNLLEKISGSTLCRDHAR